MTKSTKPAAKRKPKAKTGKRAAAAKRPRKDRCGKTVQGLIWKGVTVSVSYERDWLNMGERMPEAQRAHLEVRRVSPDWALLPITETGYRSHFVAPDAVEEAGGPVAYVTAWLDEAAKAPDWKRREQQSRQMSLF